MAGVTESNNWSTEIYRFETEDVVEGGEDGLDNLPGKQLAGRTNWLRLMLTAVCAAEGITVLNNETTQFLTAIDSRIGNAISALVDSSPAALNTLNELAAALGDDANFAMTVTNALGLKAPLASPALTGTPTAPTAALGTNTTQLANTAFVTDAILAALSSFTSQGYMLVRDEKPAGTPGGTGSVGQNIRTLNTVSSNTISGASLNSNQVTLPAGTYRIKGKAIAGYSGSAQLNIYNVTTSTVIAIGLSANTQSSSTSDIVEIEQTVETRVTFSSSTVIALRHYFENSVTNGFGAGCSSSLTQVYAQLEIIKES